jgi:hypothetical protein
MSKLASASLYSSDAPKSIASMRLARTACCSDGENCILLDTGMMLGTITVLLLGPGISILKKKKRTNESGT